MRIDPHLRQERGEEPVPHGIAELLLQDVADHAGAFGVEHVERERRLRRRGRLEGEQAHLRPVAVGDHQRMAGRDQFGEHRCRAADVGALVVCRHRLTPLQEGIAAERDDDPHLRLRWWRRGSP